MAVQPFHEWMVRVETTYQQESSPLSIQTLFQLQMVNDVVQKWLANDIERVFNNIAPDTILEGKSVVKWEERAAELEGQVPASELAVRILLENCYANADDHLSHEQIIGVLDLGSKKADAMKKCYDYLVMKKFPEVISRTFTASVLCMTEKRVQVENEEWSMLGAVWNYFFPSEDIA